MLDESGTNLALLRLYGYTPKNERVYDNAPRNQGKNITLLTTMTTSGMDLDSTVTFPGALNQATFDLYVEHTLAPLLERDEVVILDNLSVHKSQKAKDLIEARGATLLFLPTYSPDLSPIEMAFSKVKAYLRRVKARTVEVLLPAIELALATITPAQALAYFTHCGYPKPAL